MEYTISTLAAAANAITRDAGIKITWVTECTTVDVATWLDVNLAEVGEDAPVDPEDAAVFLEGHTAEVYTQEG